MKSPLSLRTFISQSREAGSRRWYKVNSFILISCLISFTYANAMTSNIKSDEHIIFFRTDAAFNPTTQQWSVPIHGWVFENEHSWFRKNAFAKVIELKYNLSRDDDSSVFFDRRTGWLISDNERNKSIVINIANKIIQLPKSEANGHFNGVALLSRDDVSLAQKNGLIEYRAKLKKHDSREFIGQSALISPHGQSIISDIDDTVKVSGVTDTKTLINYTFFQDFLPAPGMAKLYQSWDEQSVHFHFVSSSPWQLYPDLLDFLKRQNFPWASLYLKSIRFKDSSFFDLFKEGTVTKPIQIESIMARYPERSFILIGDSGEQDPEAYTQIYLKYPSRIDRIYIRNVTNETMDNSRFSSLSKRLPAGTMALFEDPETIYATQ